VTINDDEHYAELAEQARTLYTGAVLDVLDELGVKDCVLPAELTPLRPEMRFCGPAFAVEGRSHPEMDRDRSMRAILEMLGAVPAQHVVVYQPHDSTSSHLGELSVTALKARGCVGAVIDGGCRDVGHIVAEGFPVFCRYTTPIDAVGRWELLGYGHEVFFGGARVRTGDYVIADEDGIVVIPHEVRDETIARAKMVALTENLVRRAVRDGVLPIDAYERHGRF